MQLQLKVPKSWEKGWALPKQKLFSAEKRLKTRVWKQLGMTLPLADLNTPSMNRKKNCK